MSTRFARTNGTTRFNTLSIAKSPIPSLELDEEWNRLNTACNAIDDDLITARGAKASINQRFLDIEAEVANARDGKVNLLDKEDAQDALISAVQTEVANARGSTGALDTRLDVALNEDGTLKAGATQNTTEWSSAAFAGLTRSSDTQFTVNGDQTTIFLVGRKVRSLSGFTYAYHEVVSSAYATVTTVTVSGTALPSPLNDVDFGIITPVASGQSSLPVGYLIKTLLYPNFNFYAANQAVGQPFYTVTAPVAAVKINRIRRVSGDNINITSICITKYDSLGSTPAKSIVVQDADTDPALTGTGWFSIDSDYRLGGYIEADATITAQVELEIEIWTVGAFSGG